MSISFGSCIAGGRTTQHDVKCDDHIDNITFILDLQASGKATSYSAHLFSKMCCTATRMDMSRLSICLHYHVNYCCTATSNGITDYYKILTPPRMK